MHYFQYLATSSVYRVVFKYHPVLNTYKRRVYWYTYINNIIYFTSGRQTMTMVATGAAARKCKYM